MMQSFASFFARCLLYALLSIGMSAGPGARPVSMQNWELAEERCSEIIHQTNLVRRQDSSRSLTGADSWMESAELTADAALRRAQAKVCRCGHPEDGHRLRNGCVAPLLV